MKKTPTASRTYQQPGKLAEVDEDLTQDLRKDLTEDGNARDGLSRKLFPLTATEQRRYRFQLAGEEIYRGLAVYRITFTP
jgi:hypothetical protein